METFVRWIGRCSVPLVFRALPLIVVCWLLGCQHVDRLTQRGTDRSVDVFEDVRSADPTTSGEAESADQINLTAYADDSDETGSTADDALSGNSQWANELELSNSLSLDELVDMAFDNNPTIQQATATAHKAMGVRRQVGLRPNPTIGYAGNEIGDEGTAGQQGVFYQRTFVRGDKLAWNCAVADRDVQAQLWQVETQRLRVQNDVRRQFYTTLGAQRRLQVADELLRLAQGGVENAQALVDAQQSSIPDLRQAQIQLREVEILHRNAQFALTASWQQLVAVVGLPGLQLVELDPVLDAAQPPRDRDVAWGQIVSMSPQLQQAQAEVDRARARISREQVEPIPNLQVQFNALHLHTSGDEVVGVQVGLPLPFNNANEGNIDRASAEYHRSVANVRRLELSLQSQLAAAFADYQQAQNRVDTYRDAILPAQEETLELIQQAYPVQYDFLRLLTARRSLFEARLEYVNALVDLRTAEVTLDGLLLSGGLNDVPDTTMDASLRGQALSGQ